MAQPGAVIRISDEVNEAVDETVTLLRDKLGVHVTKRSIVEEAIREHVKRLAGTVGGKKR